VESYVGHDSTWTTVRQFGCSPRRDERPSRRRGTVTASIWDSRRMPMLCSSWDAALEAAPERAGAIDDGRRLGYESFDDLWGPSRRASATPAPALRRSTARGRRRWRRTCTAGRGRRREPSPSPRAPGGRGERRGRHGLGRRTGRAACRVDRLDVVGDGSRARAADGTRAAVLRARPRRDGLGSPSPTSPPAPRSTRASRS
jgi:hypothetical protein